MSGAYSGVDRPPALKIILIRLSLPATAEPTARGPIRTPAIASDLRWKKLELLAEAATDVP